MSFLTAEPEALGAAAGALTGIGSVIAGANAAAAVPHAAVVPPGLEEVSALVSMMFVYKGAEYQAMQAAGQAVHAGTVAMLMAAAAGYAATEVAGAATLL
jgi:hypothetical protein